MGTKLYIKGDEVSGDISILEVEPIYTPHIEADRVYIKTPDYTEPLEFSLVLDTMQLSKMTDDLVHLEYEVPIGALHELSDVLYVYNSLKVSNPRKSKKLKSHIKKHPLIKVFGADSLL